MFMVTEVTSPHSSAPTLVSSARDLMTSSASGTAAQGSNFTPYSRYRYLVTTILKSKTGEILHFYYSSLFSSPGGGLRGQSGSDLRVSPRDWGPWLRLLLGP